MKKIRPSLRKPDFCCARGIAAGGGIGGFPENWRRGGSVTLPEFNQRRKAQPYREPPPRRRGVGGKRGRRICRYLRKKACADTGASLPQSPAGDSSSYEEEPRNFACGRDDGTGSNPFCSIQREGLRFGLYAILKTWSASASSSRRILCPWRRRG